MIFEELRELFSNNPITEDLIGNTGDGRIDSILSEPIVIEHIKNIIGAEYITIAPPRYWYDIAIEKDGQFYPINVKITNGGTADNVSSKKGLYYALTGIRPENEKGLDKWEIFINKLIANYKESPADYYFIVCFKNTGELLFTSLKHIQILTPNGNNLPFQCNWSNNKELTTRSGLDQLKYLRDSFIASYIKRSPALDLLLQWREEDE